MTSIVIVLFYLLLTLNIFNMATPQPTLGYYKGGTLTLLILITAFCLCLTGRSPEPPNKVGLHVFHLYTHWKLRNAILAWNWYGIVLLLLTLKITSWFSIYLHPFICNSKEVGIFALFNIAWNLIKNSS